MRIFAASLATETNMFSPIPTSVDNFLDAFYAPPGEHPDRPSLCSAPLWVARHRAQREGWTLIEGSTAWAEPSGTCAQAAYERFRDEILAQISAALPLDGVLLGLHGAMVAHAYDDCEGDLITRVRELVGARAIIGVEHDLHCHLTRQRLRGADILITFKEFPHTDPVERVIVSVYVVCSVCTGIAAFMFIGYTGSATNGMGVTYELNVIAATVIGGANLMGGVVYALGAPIGAALVELIRNSLLLAGIPALWQQFFVGLFLILAVLLEQLRNRGGR